jgi:hypothetical protein
MGNFLFKIGVGSTALGCVLVATTPSNEVLSQQYRSDITAASNTLIGTAASMASTAEVYDFFLFKAARVQIPGQQFYYVGMLGRWIRLPS